MKFRLLVIAAAAALMIVGATRLPGASRDVLPEYAPPYVEVQTEALGLSAAEVESLVSLNIEELLNGTPWLDSIRSTSVPGLSSVVLTFEPGTDVGRARQLVAERLTLAYALPNVSKTPTILQPRSASGRVMMIALSSTQVSPIQMSVLARWTIRPALLAVPGVANVSVWGYRDRQLQVQVDPQRLAAENVTIDQIVRTTGNAMWVSPLTFLEASTPGTGGWIETPQQRLEVRHVFPISGPDELAKVSVEDNGKQLGAVADVVEDHQPLIGDAVLRDGPGLLLVVEKLPGANTLDVTRGLETTLDQLGPGLPGITADTTVFRPASYIETSVDHLTVGLLVGAVLVLLVLLGFLYDWRAVVISAASIAVSLTAAALVMLAFGSTMNAMVLAGLVVALVVVIDEAIVDVEGIMRRLRARRADGAEESAAAAVLTGTLEMRRVALYGTLILILPLLPVIFMEGVTGSLFQPVALSYLLAVLAALVVALTLTPALGALLLADGRAGSHESPLARWVGRVYATALARVVRIRAAAFAVAAVAALGALVALPFLTGTLVPGFKDPDLVVRWNGPAGASAGEMTRITGRLSDELRSTPGVANVTGQIGRAVLGDQVVDINSAQVFVTIADGADYGRTVAAVRSVASGYPGLSSDVQTYEQRSLRAAQGGSGEQIVVGVFGPNREMLDRATKDVSAALTEIDGVGDLHIPRAVEQPHIEIQVDLADARRYGLKPGDVRREAATLIAGLEVGSLFEDQKVFQVAVWTQPNERRSLSDVQGLLLDTPTGGHVPLGKVARVTVVRSPASIQREAVSRRVRIGVGVDGRDAGDVAHDIRVRLDTMAFPLEYHAEVLGEPAGTQIPRREMILAGIAAAILIFLLLQAAFGSWRLAALLFVSLPLALVGAVLAALVADDPVTLGSLLGFLAVLGIAARNGIALIDRYQDLERREGVPFGPELVVQGARERLLPILLTAVAGALALAPFLFAGSIAGYEVVHPIAVIIVGGLVTSTLLSLFLIPCLYLSLGSRSEAAASV